MLHQVASSVWACQCVKWCAATFCSNGLHIIPLFAAYELLNLLPAVVTGVKWDICSVVASGGIGLHWQARCHSRCDQGEAYPVCQRNPATGDAAPCWHCWQQRDQKGALFTFFMQQSKPWEVLACWTQSPIDYVITQLRSLCLWTWTAKLHLLQHSST